MLKKDDPTLPGLIGQSFAILQHGLDRVVDWGFSKMKETGDMPDTEVKKIDNPYLRRAAAFGKSTLKFLGNAGDAYYRTYEELKKDGSKK